MANWSLGRIMATGLLCFPSLLSSLLLPSSLLLLPSSPLLLPSSTLLFPTSTLFLPSALSGV